MDSETATALSRVQIAMWLPASCMVCKKPYTSVDDFLERNPRAGPGWKKKPLDMDKAFIDDACFAGFSRD